MQNEEQYGDHALFFGKSDLLLTCFFFVLLQKSLNRLFQEIIERPALVYGEVLQLLDQILIQSCREYFAFTHAGILGNPQ